jgi:hypothetical protein
VVISEWQTTGDLLINHVGYTQEVFDTLPANRVIPPDLQRHGDLGGDVVAAFMSKTFVAKVPSGQEFLYSTSIAITEILLGDFKPKQLHRFGGLQYPTVALDARGDNFALKPEFVNEHLTFVRAHFIRILGHEEPDFHWHGIDTAEGCDEQGTLLWSGKCDLAFSPEDSVYQPGVPKWATELVTRGTHEYLFPREQ